MITDEMRMQAITHWKNKVHSDGLGPYVLHLDLNQKLRELEERIYLQVQQDVNNGSTPVDREKEEYLALWTERMATVISRIVENRPTVAAASGPRPQMPAHGKGHYQHEEQWASHGPASSGNAAQQMHGAGTYSALAHAPHNNMQPGQMHPAAMMGGAAQQQRPLLMIPTPGQGPPTSNLSPAGYADYSAQPRAAMRSPQGQSMQPQGEMFMTTVYDIEPTPISDLDRQPDLLQPGDASFLTLFSNMNDNAPDATFDAEPQRVGTPLGHAPVAHAQQPGGLMGKFSAGGALKASYAAHEAAAGGGAGRGSAYAAYDGAHGQPVVARSAAGWNRQPQAGMGVMTERPRTGTPTSGDRVEALLESLKKASQALMNYCHQREQMVSAVRDKAERHMSTNPGQVNSGQYAAAMKKLTSAVKELRSLAELCKEAEARLLRERSQQNAASAEKLLNTCQRYLRAMRSRHLASSAAQGAHRDGDAPRPGDAPGLAGMHNAPNAAGAPGQQLGAPPQATWEQPQASAAQNPAAAAASAWDSMRDWEPRPLSVMDPGSTNPMRAPMGGAVAPANSQAMSTAYTNGPTPAASTPPLSMPTDPPKFDVKQEGKKPPAKRPRIMVTSAASRARKLAAAAPAPAEPARPVSTPPQQPADAGAAPPAASPGQPPAEVGTPPLTMPQVKAPPHDDAPAEPPAPARVPTPAPRHKESVALLIRSLRNPVNHTSSSALGPSGDTVNSDAACDTPAAKRSRMESQASGVSFSEAASDSVCFSSQPDVSLLAVCTAGPEPGKDRAFSGYLQSAHTGNAAMAVTDRALVPLRNLTGLRSAADFPPAVQPPVQLQRLCEDAAEENACVVEIRADPQSDAHLVVVVVDEARTPWQEMHVLVDKAAEAGAPAAPALRIAWPCRPSVSGEALERQTALHNHVNTLIDARAAALLMRGRGRPPRKAMSLSDFVQAWRWGVDLVALARDSVCGPPASESTVSAGEAHDVFELSFDPTMLDNCY